MPEAMQEATNTRTRGASVSESILFRGSVSARLGKGGRGGRGQTNNRRASSSRMSEDGLEIYDQANNDEDEGLGDMALLIDDIADEQEVSLKPPRPSSKPPPPPGAPPMRPPSQDGASFPLMKPKPPPPGGAPPTKPKPPPPGGAPPKRPSNVPPPSPKGSSGNIVPLPPKRSSGGVPASPSGSRPLPPTPPSAGVSPPSAPALSPKSSPSSGKALAPKAFMPPPPPTSGNKAPVINQTKTSPETRISEAPNITPRPITKRTKSSGGVNSAFSMPIVKNEANYEVVIHSSMFKRGKMKWNQRYCVLIKPRASPSSGGLLFYFKNAKQFMKQASSGGSVSVDVARLFAAPSAGKEVPKELDLKGCRVEPNADGWSTPTGTFGLMIIDDKGVEYPFATDSNQMRNQWNAGLDSVMHEHEDDGLGSFELDSAAFSSPVVPLVVKNTTYSSSDLSSPNASSRSIKDNDRRGQQSGLFDVSKTGLVYELINHGGGDENVIHSVHVRIALKLLSDRRFLTSRTSVEVVMKELVTYMGDPGQIPCLLARTLATDNEALISSFLSRLIELLSLEPIDSPTTSRIVGCSLAILAAWTRGSPITHRLITTYPLLGELSFELNQLITKTDHPGLLNQVSILLSGIYTPTLVPINPNVILNENNMIKLNLDTDIEDLVNVSLDLPAVASDGHYLDFLKRDRCPLWPILFKLMQSSSEMPRVNVLSLLNDLSSFPEVCVAICNAHETPQPKDRKSASTMLISRSMNHSNNHSSNRNKQGGHGLEIDSFVEDVDDDDKDEDSFNSNIGLENIYNHGGGVPETSNVMALGNRGGRSAIASVPRNGGRAGLASVPRQGLTPLRGNRAGIASVPRGGITPLSRNGLHSASSPVIQINQAHQFHQVITPTVKRRSPVVAHLVNLLSVENGDETRYFALSFMCNLLTQAQAIEGYAPVLRAVCTPDVMSATDLLSSIHVKAKRYLQEAVMVSTKSQLPRSGSVFSMDLSEVANRKPVSKLLSLEASAKLAIHENIATSSALCLWLIGCLLTQHSAMSSIRGIKASESFTDFCEKLAASV